MGLASEVVPETTTLLKNGENCCALTQADRFALIVDADAYFDAFRRAAERAQRSITILAWDFDSRTPLGWRDTTPSLTVGEFLNTLARRRRNLRIQVLDWDYPLIYGLDRDLLPVFGMGWKPHRRVRVRYDSAHPLGASQHQKIVVIDDRLAFVGGLDLASKRWDTPKHRAHDPRRVCNGRGYPPFHDVMAAVDGAAAQQLAGIARRRWRQATGETLAPLLVDGDPWPNELAVDVEDARVAIACTAPPMNGDPGAREVERLYLDMIARARRYIYFENQYFTSRSVGEALAARLAEPEGPEIVLVTRLLSHGWLEEVTMHTLRARLIRDLRAVDRYQRFYAYYPHVEGLPEGTCVDLHAKVTIVDDEWLRVGSSNLSNRSMGLDTECDVLLEATGSVSSSAAVRTMRDRLLAEHLDVPPEAVSREVERTGTIMGAVAALGSEGRSLKRLEPPTEVPEAVVDAIALPADPERPVSLDVLLEQFAPEVEEPEGRHLWAKALITASTFVAIVVAWRFTPLAQLTGADEVVRRLAALAGRWWVAPLVVLAYTPGSFIMFPRAVLTLSAVVVFGPWTAFSCAITGNLIAASVGYLAGRRLHRDTVRRLAGEKLNRLSHALRRRSLLALTAIRLVPLGPFAIQNVVAGTVRVKPLHFMLATLFGLLPGTLITTIFGGQVKAMLLEGREIDYGVVAFVVLVVLAGGFVVRRALSHAKAAELPRDGAVSSAPPAPEGA